MVRKQRAGVRWERRPWYFHKKEKHCRVNSSGLVISNKGGLYFAEYLGLGWVRLKNIASGVQGPQRGGMGLDWLIVTSKSYSQLSTFKKWLEVGRGSPSLLQQKSFWGCQSIIIYRKKYTHTTHTHTHTTKTLIVHICKMRGSLWFCDPCCSSSSQILGFYFEFLSD
jgi:hypothetical protein